MKVQVWIAVALLCTASTGHGDPVQSEVAITVPRGLTTVRSFVRCTDWSVDGAATLESQNEVVYGLSARTNLLLFIPVVRRRMEIGGVTRRSSGLGDVSLLVKQRVWKRNHLQTQDRVSLISGVKLPTGASGQSDRHGRLPPSLQPGTGSFDFPVGVFYAHDSATGFFADALYTFKTEHGGYRFGDTLRYDLAYTRALSGGEPRQHFVWAVVELNGLLAGRDRNGGRPLADSGGHRLFVSPGVRLVHWTGRWVLDLSYQLPLITDLNGTQLEPRRSWLLGVRTSF